MCSSDLFGSPGPWRRHPHVESLRRSIVQKNEWFFHRSRPANMAYIFGFRKKEQGRNATEVLGLPAEGQIVLPAPAT